MSERVSEPKKRVIVIKFAIKVEVDGEDVQVCQEPYHQSAKNKSTECRDRRPKFQTPQINPRRIGGKDPAFLYQRGLLGSSSYYQDTGSEGEDGGQ